MVSRIVVLVMCLRLAVAPAAARGDDEAQAARDAAMVETLLRLPGFNFRQNPKHRDAVMRHLERQKGTIAFLELVEKLEVHEATDELQRLALAKPDDSLGVNAAELLFQFEESDGLSTALRSEDEKVAAAAATVLGLLGSAESAALLRDTMMDTEAPRNIRQSACRALGRTRRGERILARIVESDKLPAELTFAAANVLHASRDQELKELAAERLPLPATANKVALPPLKELVPKKGDVTKGKLVFAEAGTCAKCHKVNNEGKDVGPDLSEIGSKLSKEALYVSILDPSAGISHNYESYLLATEDGDQVTGLLVSETDDEVTIKTAESIVKTFARDNIVAMKKQPISLMPADLQKDLTVEQLVDLVEYMATLKKTQ